MSKPKIAVRRYLGSSRGVEMYYWYDASGTLHLEKIDLESGESEVWEFSRIEFQPVVNDYNMGFREQFDGN